MSTEKLIARLAESAGEVPSRVPVHEVRRHSTDELHERATRFLASTGEALGLGWQRADWVERDQHTVVRLTDGARAIVSHASGAMTLSTGLGPMDSPFDRLEERDVLERLVQERGEQLGLRSWAGSSGDLKFERLWQIKGAAADREGKATDPVLFRTVGAYRHYLSDLPVWGRASASVKLAGGGTLDTVTLQMREPSGEVLDEVQTLPAEAGAKAVAGQLEALMGRSDLSLDDIARPHWMHFGYLSLSARKAQRVLEPVYVAQVDLEGDYPQGFVLAVNAGEKVYMPLARQGMDPPVSKRRQQNPAPA
jgi:hypothetical protein